VHETLRFNGRQYVNTLVVEEEVGFAKAHSEHADVYPAAQRGRSGRQRI
jgi:hypothetical protein